MIRRLTTVKPGDRIRYLDPRCMYAGKTFVMGRDDPSHLECDCENLGPVTKKVLYLAHPVSGDMIGNAFKAVRWIKWFHEKFDKFIVVAPWVAEVLGFPGSDALPKGSTAPGAFDRVIADDEEVVRHLDGVIGVGGRLSPGMQRERDAALADSKSWTDMTRFTSPEDVPADFEIDEDSL